MIPKGDDDNGEEEDGGSKLRLETSERTFENVLSLVYHYSNRREELPTNLRLPQTLRESDSRQNLTSMALLGRDFWRYPMSFPSNRSSSGNAEECGDGSNADQALFQSRSERKSQGCERSGSFTENLHPSQQVQTLNGKG